MFEYIRTHQRLMQFLLFIVMLPFLLTFRNFSFNDSDQTIAKVGGKSISQQDLDRALQGVSPEAKTIPDLRKQVFDSLVSEAALEAEARQDHALPSQVEVGTALLESQPEIAKMSKEQRDTMLTMAARARGLSIPGLEEEVRRSLIESHFVGTVKSTAFLPSSVAARLFDYIGQSREVQQFALKTSDYTSQVKVTDDMIKAYYDKNLAQYQNAEQAKIEYVVFSEDALAQQITVSDDDALKYYKDNVTKLFTVEPQWRLSHILIAVKPDASAADQAAAKDKAEKIVAEARKSPAGFAQLAKEKSEDPGSAESGGDLGYFTSAPSKAKEGLEPILSAMQKMKTGEISEPIRTSFGYHVIEVVDAKPAEIKTFDAVKQDVLAQLKKQQAHSKFADLRDTFDHTVYEQSDSLKPAVDKLADKFKLNIETASVTRKPDPNVAQTAPVNNPKFLNAVFTDDVLKNKHNTDAVEVRDGVLISGRVTQYQPASQKPLEQVKTEIAEVVTQNEAKALAEKAAAAKLAALQAKDDIAGFEAPKMVTAQNASGFDASVARALFKANATKLPAFVRIEVPGQGYSVFRINKVIPPAAVDPAFKEQFTLREGAVEAAVYLEALKDKAGLKIVRESAVNTAPATPGAPAGGAN
jgi:peptidyl-prolyl cis-trans isomerase D